MTELVTYEVRERVGVVTLNRPEKLNAINDEMSGQMHNAINAALDDPDSRVILIRATGRAFCTGRDTTMLGHRAHEESDYHFVLRHSSAICERSSTPSLLSPRSTAMLSAAASNSLCQPTSVSLPTTRR